MSTAVAALSANDFVAQLAANETVKSPIQNTATEVPTVQVPTAEVTEEKTNVSFTDFTVNALLKEEEEGFFAVLANTAKDMNDVRKMIESKKSLLQDHIFTNVFKKISIPSRATVCLYRAHYCDTMINAGLDKKSKDDKKVIALVKIVRDIYFKLHDQAVNAGWFPQEKRSETAAKIRFFQQSRLQKANNGQVLAEMLRDPMFKSISNASYSLEKFMKLDNQFDLLNKEVDLHMERLMKLEDQVSGIKVDLHDQAELTAHLQARIQELWTIVKPKVAMPAAPVPSRIKKENAENVPPVAASSKEETS